jgi:hypothetical protein
VKLNPRQPTNAQRGQAVLMLEPSELPLHSSAATVEITPPLRLTRDQRIAPIGFEPDGLGLALPGRAAPLRCLAAEVGPGKRPTSVLTDRNIVQRAGLLLLAPLPGRKPTTRLALDRLYLHELRTAFVEPPRRGTSPPRSHQRKCVVVGGA